MEYPPKLPSKADVLPSLQSPSSLNKQVYSSRDAVYISLKQQTLSLKLPPGTAISEKEISHEFNVSRTPVRKALFDFHRKAYSKCIHSEVHMSL